MDDYKVKGLDAADYAKQLENARNYKSSEGMFDKIAQNERFVMSDQWTGVNQQNLPPTVYNYLQQLGTTFISSVMATPMQITRLPDEISEDNPVVKLATAAFNKFDKINWERCKMETLNEKVLQDAFVGGLGGTYWDWDDSIEMGNDFLIKGDMTAYNIDAISLYVANPTEQDIQRQDWIKVVIRMTVAQAKARAKAKGASQDKIDMICGDDTRVYEAYDKAQNPQLGSDMLDYIIHLEKRNGRVWECESTATVVVKPLFNKGLRLYPVATMVWMERKKFFYGHSIVTHQIANQKVANYQASMRHLHAMLAGIPKVIVNSAYIKGFTNTVGGIHTVSTLEDVDLKRMIQYVQPAQMTFDVDKSIDDSINRSKSLLGGNQALLGESNPDNFRAIMAQQKQAGIPLESVIRRYKQYLEDVALIWQDYYQNKYQMARRIRFSGDDLGLDEESIVDITGTQFKDIYMQTKIEVGANTQWSEGAQFDTALKLFEMGIVTDPELLLDNVPKALLANKDAVLKAIKERKEQEQAMQAQQLEAQQVPQIMPPQQPM